MIVEAILAARREVEQLAPHHPAGRELALTITKLEEAQMWAERAERVAADAAGRRKPAS